MLKVRFRTLVAAAALAGGVLIATVFVYLLATAQIHKNAQAIPSSVHLAPSPAWFDAIQRARQIVRAGVVDQNLPGLAVAVGAGGDVVWAEGFGWEDIKTREPVTSETRFRIGTASTVLTSAAVGVLLQKHLLNLDEEIHTYVPQAPKQPWPMTLRQLMGHSAGLSSDSANDAPLLSERCDRPVDALQHFARDELLFEPGTQFRHSKYGWILVSAAVEAATGQPFLSVMREQIFQPLGMNHTGAESSKEENPERIGEPAEDMPLITLVKDVILEPLGIAGVQRKSATRESPATFYSPRFGADPRRFGVGVTRPHNLSCYAGSMVFFSTPSDLVRFGLAINSGKLLQTDTVQLLQTSPRLTSGQETGYGLGWDLETVTLAGERTQSVGHDGESLGGMMMSFMTFRERGIVLAVMSNTSYADTRALALDIAQTFAEHRRK